MSRLIPLLVTLSILGCSSTPSPETVAPEVPEMLDAAADAATDAASDMPAEVSLRIATFNASMFRDSKGALTQALQGGSDAQILAAVHVIQHIRPDVILINEFDWDERGDAARILREEVLTKPAAAEVQGIDYPYMYVPGTNTGIASGADLDKNGQVVTSPGSRDYGNDALGYGTFHGQYGMIILSKYPIDSNASRTFQNALWKDFPGALIPKDWYLPQAVDVMRLSSKNHADVVLDIKGHRVHVLASHPTPPGFDGDEDRNGKRNHDEIAFWSTYISPESATTLRDDAGVTGGLQEDEAFVVLGDLNSDPRDGGSISGGIAGLLGHARVIDPQPKSAGAVSASARDGQANTVHKGDAALDTADFSDGFVGNVRVDYVLPSTKMRVNEAGVFWPDPGEPLSEVAALASDHHLVWVDVTLGGK